MWESIDNSLLSIFPDKHEICAGFSSRIKKHGGSRGAKPPRRG